MYQLMLVYIVALVLANHLIFTFGISAVPVVSFFLIGLDITLRDILQNYYNISRVRMLGLLVVAGIVTRLTNSDAAFIADASVIAFFVSAVLDYLVFTASSGTFEQRVLKSNAVSAVVDSGLFQYLAFGSILWDIFLLQSAVKWFGGVLWLYIWYTANRFLMRVRA